MVNERNKRKKSNKKNVKHRSIKSASCLMCLIRDYMKWKCFKSMMFKCYTAPYAPPDILTDWLKVSSSSVKATAINKLIILSLLGGRHCKKPYLASLEALCTKVSMVVASTVHGVGCSSLGLFVVETTVAGIACGILVAHIGRCGLFFVWLQQAVISLSISLKFIERMNVLGHGLIFQPVLTSL